MKIFNSIKKTGLFLAMGIVSFTACNKLKLDPVPNPAPAQGTMPTLATLLDDPNFSIFKAAVAKAKLLTTLGVPTVRFTVFAPDDAACTASGISAGVIAFLDSATVTSIVNYHIIAQVIDTASISPAFPNFEYPTNLNPTIGTPKFNPFARLSTFPSKRPGIVWVNNIPVTAVNIEAVNGIMHKVARVVAPPSLPLWSRIATDPQLTFLKAAIQRADSGTTATAGTLNQNNLQSVLTEFGPKLTVFAPTDSAFKALLYQSAYPLVYAQAYTAVYNQALLGGATPAQADAAALAYVDGQTTLLTSAPTIFQNPALFGALTAQTVKGIVVYHVLGKTAFSVNLPATLTSVPTLLNSAIPAHPGIGITATFAGPFVTAATIKGLGNTAAGNVLINPTPNPNGSSDQFFINGTLHKIDKVLLPQ